MWNKLLFASLLALTSSSTATIATADTAPAPRKPDTACLVQMVATTEVFRIEQKTDMKDGTSSSFVIVSNGAWSFTEKQDGKVLRSSAGCLSTGELKAFELSLSRASWKTSKAQVTCAAVAFETTEYSYKGKVKLALRMCDGTMYDAATQKAVEAANALVAKLSPKN